MATESPKSIRGYPVKELAHMAIEAKPIDWLLRRAGKLDERRGIGNGLEASLHTRIAVMRMGAEARATETKRLDEFDKQFLVQTEQIVDMGPLGLQRAYGVAVELPSSLKPETATEKPPVFIIPAWSGDTYGVEPLMRAAALQGRRAITVAYPESFMGTTTPEFMKAVQEHPEYGPHTAFFKQAIKQMMGETGNFELWGYSTGGAIAATILRDEEFSQRTTSAVLFAPTSLTTQTMRQFYRGAVLGEGKHIGRLALSPKHHNLVEFADIADVLGPRKKRPTRRERQSFNELRGGIGKALLQRITGVKIDLTQSRVQETGKIVVAVAGDDQITKSGSPNVVEEIIQLPNDQIVLRYDKAGSHLTPLTHATIYAQTVTQAMEPNAPKFGLIE